MNFKRAISLSAYLLLLINPGQTQIIRKSPVPGETGLPIMHTYLPDHYQAHGQNWDILQDHDGFIYFANTDGVVLQYDGVTWRNIPIGNGSIVRSLAIDSTGIIYVGSQNEFGYLEADSVGSLRYISLASRLEPALREFGNVWQIHATPDGVYFSTRKYLYRLEASGEIRAWEAQTSFQSAFYLQQLGIFIHQMQTGLMALRNDSLQLIPGGDTFSGDRVYVLLPGSNGRLLVGARYMGLFVLEKGRVFEAPKQLSSWLVENQIYHGLRLKEGGYALATIRAGTMLLDENLNVTMVVNTDAGLPDNNVWFVFQDREGSLWMATNRGIAKAVYPSSFTVFDQRTGLEGNVQDIVRHRGTIYAATGLGLYRQSPAGRLKATSGFTQVPGLRSQCWSLLSLNGQLLVSCNQGVYQLDQNGFSRITDKSAWNMIRSDSDSNRIFLGLDDGVASLYRSGMNWRDEGRLPGISAEARTITEDDGLNLWIGTVYEGIFRIRFNPPGINPVRIDHFDTANGLPSINYNLVFPGPEKLLFGTGDGIYVFDEVTSVFSPLDPKSRDAPIEKRETSYTMLSAGKNGDIWFNRNDRPALIRSDTLFYQDFMGLPKSSLYTFYPETDGTVWMGGTGGILRYVPSENGSRQPQFRTVIRHIAINRDSTIFSGADFNSFQMPEIKYTQHDMRFEFAALSFVEPEHNEYQYILEGFDPAWSTWSGETRKDYTNIPEGRYTFRIRSRNVFGTIGHEASVSFLIMAPWFRSGWAYLAYAVLIAVMIYFSVRTIVSRAKRKAISERMKVYAIEKAAEEKLRSRVAADFHDELGNRITRISLFGEILLSSLKDSNEKSQKYISRIIENADTLYNETRDFVWQLDPTKDSLYDLTVRLRKFADELFEGTDISFEIAGLSRNYRSLKLTMDQRQHVLRIFKEAMHNALKYAACKNIRLSVQYQDSEVTFLCEDDGIGFDINDLKDHGNGLTNMKNRSDALNGVLTIDSDPGRGTRINLTIKLPEQVVV